MGRALVSVKSGSVNSSQIRDLKGVLEREKAEIGLFVTLEEPSSPMQLEATTAGVYTSALSGRDYPRVQILTVRELLEEHRRPDLPLLDPNRGNWSGRRVSNPRHSAWKADATGRHRSVSTRMPTMAASWRLAPVQASSAASSSGSVTGRRQAKSRQTKAVARPLIAKRPCSKSSMLNLGSPSARTLYGWNPRRTTSTRARVAAAPGSPTIATCVTRADAKSSAPSPPGK